MANGTLFTATANPNGGMSYTASAPGYIPPSTPVQTPNPVSQPQPAAPTSPAPVSSTYNSGNGALMSSSGSPVAAPAGAQQSANGLWYLNGQAYSANPGSGATGGFTSTSSTNPQDQIDIANTNQNTLNKQYDSAYDTFKTTMQGFQMGTTPLTSGEQAQVDELTNSFKQAIEQQKLQNIGATGTAQIRGYQTGAAQYDPTFQAKTIGAIVSAGIQKVTDLNLQMAGEVSKLTMALRNNDMTNARNAWLDYSTYADKKQTEFQKTITDAKTAIKDAQDKVVQDKKTIYDQVTKPIQDLTAEAKKNGAPKEITDAMSGSQSVEDAMKAAGDWLQTATGTMGEYVFYKQQAEAAGVTPKSYTEWTKQKTAADNAAAYNKAYVTEAGKAAGIASASPVDTTPLPSGLGGDGKGGSILAQTGLSIAAFNYLTQGTASMSRMPAAQRNAIMNEAGKWLNKNGVDISTFQSQYKAYNEVVQNNIARANNTTIAAQEVSGTVDQFLQDFTPSDVNAKDMFGFGGHTLSVANVLALATGKQVNNPLATKYSFDIQTMTNDLAAYYAASRSVGASGTVPTPDDADKATAAAVIANGINTGSATAFKQAIDANEAKVTKVVQNAVTNSQKQVWSLFGVGDKYVGPTNSADNQIQSQQAEDSQVTKGLSNIKATNQSVYSAASGMYTSINPDTGQPYTAADILQAFPELTQ